MINIRMHHKEVLKLSPKIIVVGVGGAGGNAVNNMIGAGLDGVEFLVCNTDAQALEGSLCERRLQLGVAVTNGLGAGARPEVGRDAAEESLDEVMRYLDGANMAFVTAGMGGGTGTGAAPVIAKAAREKGILTVGVVTKPFHFEGSYRMKMAEQGIEEMQDYVDTLIVIPNQNLFRIANEKTTFAEAFRMADNVLQSAVRGVTDLMVRPGEINLDFADIRSVMMEMGKAMMGTGEASGEDRAEHAAEAAINNPLLDDISLKGAKGVIINVTGGHDITLFEVDQACNRIRDEVDPNANIIVGSSFDDSMEGVMRVSVVATGIDVAEEKGRAKPPSTRSWNVASANDRERKLERSQPNAESMQRQPEQLAPFQPVSAPPSYMARPAAPVAPVPAAVHAQVQPQPAMPLRRQEEPESGLLYYGAEAAPVQEPIGKKPESASAPASVLRGTVQNDAFIPPQPVEVARPQTDIHAQPFVTAQKGAGASQEQQDMPAAPRAGQAPSSFHRRRGASFIERITGQLRASDDMGAQGQDQVSAPAASAEPLPGVSLRAQQRFETQGSLAIDAPSIKADPALDDELDIPAFLRRQAN